MTSDKPAKHKFRTTAESQQPPEVAATSAMSDTADPQDLGPSTDPIPLHCSEEPMSFTADAETYLAHRKVPELLEWVASNILHHQPPDVLSFVRNLTALQHSKFSVPEDGNTAGGQGKPIFQTSVSDHVSLLHKSYVAFSDSRNNENETDHQGHPLLKSTTKQNTGAQAESMPNFTSVQHLKLTYFSHRGRCDLPWILMALNKNKDMESEINWVSWDEFSAGGLREQTPFGQLPILEVTMKDEESETTSPVTLAETVAISRYLAKIGGFLPTSPIDAAAMDSLVTRLATRLRTIELVTASTAEKQDTQYNDIITNRLPLVLASVEHRMRRPHGNTAPGLLHNVTSSTDEQPRGSSSPLLTNRSARKFLCGARLTWADLALFCDVDLLFRWGASPETLQFSKYTHVAAWFARVAAMKDVKTFVDEHWEGKEIRW